MSKLSEYLAPQSLSYPGACHSAALAPPQAPYREGLLERLFAPNELPYPVVVQPPASASTESHRIVRVTIESPAVSGSLSEERIDALAEFASVAHAVEIDSAPVVLSVPDGFDRVELLFGSIVGEDAEALVALGEPRVREAAVVPRGTLTVTVPWKFAPWLSLPARRLLVEMVAIFTKAT